MKKIISSILIIAMVMTVASCSSGSSSKSNSKKKKKDSTKVEETSKETSEATSAEETLEETTETTLSEEELRLQYIAELDSNPLVNAYEGVDGMDTFSVYSTNNGLYADYMFYRLTAGIRGIVTTISDYELLIEYDYDGISMSYRDNGDGTYTLEVLTSTLDYLPVGETRLFFKIINYGASDEGLKTAINDITSDLKTLESQGIYVTDFVCSLHNGYLDFMYTETTEGSDYKYLYVSSMRFDVDGNYVYIHRFGLDDNQSYPVDTSIDEILTAVGYPYEYYSPDFLLDAKG